jgi:hypothetical protein
MATFYLGKYLVTDSIPRDEVWLLPKDNDFESFIETSNVEELRANPEDFDIVVESVQSGSEKYFRVESPDVPDYERKRISDSMFYGFYYGYAGRGRDQQGVPIAPGDFYTVPIESGSLPGSKQIVRFC